MANVEIGMGKSARQAYGLRDVSLVPSRRTRDPEDVELIGQLNPLATRLSSVWITPFVGVVEQLGELQPSSSEVAAVLEVPLEELLDPEVYHEELWPEPDSGAAPLEDPSGLRRMHFFELYGDTVWGATARMLYQLLTIATGTDGGGGADTTVPTPDPLGSLGPIGP